MAIQASLPVFRSSSLDGMEGGGGLPNDFCQSFQQQPMVMMPWPLPPLAASTTGFSLPSSSTSDPPVSVDPSRQFTLNLLEKQRIETDQYLRQQTNRLVAALQQQAKRHTGAILRSLESKVTFLLRQQEEELAKANQRALELELRLRGAEEDRAKWQQLAMENEAMVISLGNALEQVREPRFSSTNGGPSARTMSSTLGQCRACGRRDACAVLLPCSHLCCCGPCATFLEACPLCSSVKRGSVEVLLE